MEGKGARRPRPSAHPFPGAKHRGPQRVAKRPSTCRPPADARFRRPPPQATALLLATSRARLPVSQGTTAHVDRQAQNGTERRNTCAALSRPMGDRRRRQAAHAGCGDPGLVGSSQRQSCPPGAPQRSEPADHGARRDYRGQCDQTHPHRDNEDIAVGLPMCESADGQQRDDGTVVRQRVEAAGGNRRSLGCWSAAGHARAFRVQPASQ